MLSPGSWTSFLHVLVPEPLSKCQTLVCFTSCPSMHRARVALSSARTVARTMKAAWSLRPSNPCSLSGSTRTLKVSSVRPKSAASRSVGGPSPPAKLRTWIVSQTHDACPVDGCAGSSSSCGAGPLSNPRAPVACDVHGLAIRERGRPGLKGRATRSPSEPRARCAADSPGTARRSALTPG